MHRNAAATFVVVLAGLGGLYSWVRLRSERGGADLGSEIVVQDPGKHLVTQAMADASRSAVNRAAPPFEAVATDGRTYKLAELYSRGPVVLTFVKDGCPCSQAAQPFFNQLHAAYPEASFLGVIDTESEQARKWARQFDVNYPLMLDPTLRAMRDFRVENSAYVVVIDSDGQIRKHWPGFSTAMLRELGASIATLTGSSEQSIDVSDAPAQLFTGCPFDL